MWLCYCTLHYDTVLLITLLFFSRKEKRIPSGKKLHPFWYTILQQSYNTHDYSQTKAIFKLIHFNKGVFHTVIDNPAVIKFRPSLTFHIFSVLFVALPHTPRHKCNNPSSVERQSAIKAPQNTQHILN